MATVNVSYQNIATAIAITSADGNGDGVWCSSALVDNQTNKYVDALVGGSLQVGTVTADGTIDIYVAASWDGVEFTAGVDAGDADITWGTTGSTHVGGEKDLILLGVVNVDDTDDDNDVVFGPYSIAQACGGVMPLEWCIVIENNTGAALHATGTNNHLEYTGIEYTSA
jgi:hypothetical protein